MLFVTVAALLSSFTGAVLASPINAELLNIMKTLIGVNNTPYFIGTRSSDNSRTFTSKKVCVALQNMTAAVLQMVQALDPHVGNCLSMDKHSIRVVPCWGRLPFLCYRGQIGIAKVTTERTDLDTSTPKEETDRDDTTDSAQRVVHHVLCGTEGYKFYVRTASCYKLHKEFRRWDDAAATCVSESGHLVVIDDDVEAQLIKTIGIKQQYPFTYIGLRDYTGHNDWESVNGKRLEDVYHVWESGTPTGLNCFCGMIRPTGAIDNYSCDVQSDFICEKLPKNI